ncbi:PilZ domain-containing protein [Lysobacter fragariae]
MDTEQRRAPRKQLAGAVMIVPNGHGHDAQIFDISAGGARFGLSNDWAPTDGASLRVFFLSDTDHPIMLHGHVTRVAVDHLGFAFEPAQDESISELMQLLR